MYKRLYPYLTLDKKSFILFFFIKIYFFILTLLLPLVYKMLVYDVIICEKFDYLKFVLAFYLGIFIMETIGKIVYQKNYNKFSFSLLNRIKEDLMGKIFSSKNEEISKYKSSDLIERVQTDVEEVGKYLFNDLIDFTFYVLSALIIGIILLYNSYILAAVCFISIPITFVVANFMGKHVMNITKKHRQKFAEYKNFLQNIIVNWKEIKMHNLYLENGQLMKEHWADISIMYTKKQIFVYLNRAILQFKELFLVKVNLYFLGGLLVLHGHMKIAILFVFMNYFEKFYGNIEGITNSLVSFKERMPLIEKVFDILDIPNDSKETNEICNNKIEVKNLTYAYPGYDQEVLKSVSLEIKPGDKIAIVGKSGCGKTTFVKLLLGYYYPEQGEILLGGHSIKEYTKESLEKNITAIMQDSIMFNLSIRENFKLVKEGVTISEIENVCKKVRLHKVIKSLPNGYDSVIGEGGNKLSGGQKQCLAVARMLLLQSPIVILDEFTSAMDKKKEKHILSLVKEYTKDKTLVIISHRKETVELCDRVVLFGDGKVLDIGEHEEVYQRNHYYNQIFGNQLNEAIAVSN